MSASISAPAESTALRTRVPYAEYAQLPGVSITRLKNIDHSPKLYQFRLGTPKESDALTLGTAAHVAVLEPNRFNRAYATWSARTEAGRMRPRAGKDFEAFEAANDGKSILTEDERSLALAIQGAVRGNQDAMRYLERGEPEVSMQWRDNGTRCKGRVDWLTRDDGYPVVVGLKTSRDCRRGPFGRQAASLKYASQWSYYLDGYTAITGDKARVVEIVVESAPPHDVAVYVITSEILERGRDQYQTWLTKLAKCEAERRWPGAQEGETHLVLPPWAYEDAGALDADLSSLGGDE